MGSVTTDQRDPGLRKVATFSVEGALNANQSDQNSKGYGFTVLKNCLVSNRQGALMKRPGSVTETIASSLGLPLGCSEYIVGTDVGFLPINRTLLVNFGGSAFWQQRFGVWSAVAMASSRLSFSTNKLSTFAKIGTNMQIAAGRPAKWAGDGRTIERVGIVPPGTAPIVSSYTAGSIVLTSGTFYVATYFDSTTGLESDWSPESTATGVHSNVTINLALPVETQQNWDRIRIYRCLDGGAAPYLVVELAAGTTTFADNMSDGSLTLAIEDNGFRATPPDRAFLLEAYANRYWYVDSANPYRLVYSEPYTGSDIALEYFGNDVLFDEPITGLRVVAGKMLIFHARNIWYVAGGSESDFVKQPFVPGVGTLFNSSIATNGRQIVFLGEEGFVSISPNGGDVVNISKPIDPDLQAMLAGSFNALMYVSGAWSTSLRQFVFSIATASTAGAPWEVVGSGAIAEWETTPGATTDIWVDLSNPNTSNVLNVRMYGWSPEQSDANNLAWHEFTFPQIPNGGSSGAYPTILFHPRPSNDTLDPQQDRTYMGWFNGFEGHISGLFRKDSNTDDGTLITGFAITGRIVPGSDNGGFKFFQRLGFQNDYSDPTADGDATLQYLIDFDDPQVRDYASALIDIPTVGRDTKPFPTMKARHIHLVITDTSQSQDKILLSQFFIHYRERFAREAR